MPFEFSLECSPYKISADSKPCDKPTNDGSTSSSNEYEVQVYKHDTLGLRVVFGQVPGPLATLSIVVPTVTDNSKGLAHTLEHLIFCGSKNYPNRGYLDALAHRSLSNGTNAFTDTDNTVYTYGGAGQDGVINVLPVFLDHVLQPLLKDEQFTTEVYHVDENGKQQGVVFSEMSSCMNELYELLNRHGHEMMYPKESAYHHEFGGDTTQIPLLTNQEIIDYHRKFYNPRNISIILIGSFTKSEFVLETLSKYLNDTFPDSLKNGNVMRIPQPPIREITGTPDDVKRTIRYPGSKMDAPAIKWMWPGPKFEDVYTRTALNLLGAYLASYPSSPLQQRFVECENPICHEATFYENPCKPPTFEFVVTGLPDDEQDSNSDHGKGKKSSSKKRNHMLEDGYMTKEILKTLKDIYKSKFSGDPQPLANILQRNRDQLIETHESEPHGLIRDAALQAITAFHFSGTSVDLEQPDFQAYSHTIKTLDRLSQEPVDFWLDLLKNWLIDSKYRELVAIPDIKLGQKLEEEERKAEAKRVEEMGGMEGQEKRAAEIKRAIELCAVNLPDDVKDSMAPVPNLANVPTLPYKEARITIPATEGLPKGNPSRPFEVFDLFESRTEMVTVRLHIPLFELDDTHRLFLYLFEQSILSSDMVLPPGVPFDEETWEDAKKNKKSRKLRRIEYTVVSNKLNNNVCEAAVGLGDGAPAFKMTSLTEHFGSDSTSKADRYKYMIRWIIQGILFTDFTPERIQTFCKNLLGDIADYKRGEKDICILALHRILFPTVYDSAQLKEGESRYNKSSIDSNHQTISICRQEPFIRAIAKAFDNPKDSNNASIVKSTLEHLKAIQNYMFGLVASGDWDSDMQFGFVSIAAPFGSTTQNKNIDGSPTKSATPFAEEIAKYFVMEWDRNLEACVRYNNNTKKQSLSSYAYDSVKKAFRKLRLGGSKSSIASTNGAELKKSNGSSINNADGAMTDKSSKSSSDSGSHVESTSDKGIPPGNIASAPDQVKLRKSPFPFPRPRFFPDVKHPVGVHIPSSTVQCSFLMTRIPCNLCLRPSVYDPKPCKVIDAFALLLLCNILSRTDGPIYNAVRANGYAYGASIVLYQNLSQLGIQIHNATNVAKAQYAIWKIIEEMATPEGWTKYVNKFEIELCKSTFSYEIAVEGQTTKRMFNTQKWCSLWGFESIGERISEVSDYIKQVTEDDFKRVYKEHLARFIDPNAAAVMVVVTPVSTGGDDDGEDEAEGQDEANSNGKRESSLDSHATNTSKNSDSSVSHIKELLDNPYGYKFVERKFEDFEFKFDFNDPDTYRINESAFDIIRKGLSSS
ncbi:hypothetical protein H4219_004624 [Mycoemilia scoparia]|uniref:Uncharacterized protein n=1 Tax=Mycoemilia scoparia TaxID=417184 RepID=A0A9W8A0K7_9FUNG|nr:hypothetical protein H4219_004624 [Mycoemilia scoparia]